VIRAELRKLAGPEVASSFLDLGVAQTPVNRPSALQGKRVASGLSKLWRTSVLSLNLKRRCHFVAASGIPASMYGVASARSATVLSSPWLPRPWRPSGAPPRAALASLSSNCSSRGEPTPLRFRSSPRGSRSAPPCWLALSLAKTSNPFGIFHTPPALFAPARMPSGALGPPSAPTLSPCVPSVRSFPCSPVPLVPSRAA
jgi:hypothetical protein